MADPAAASLCAVLVEALRPAASAFGDARLLASWLHAVDPALDPDVTALADVVGDLAAPSFCYGQIAHDRSFPVTAGNG